MAKERDRQNVRKNRSYITIIVAILMIIIGVKTDVYAHDELTGKTALEISQMMDKGWNLGNTFDADGGKAGDIYSFETSWGNPQVCKELIDGVKAAGFKTIRIPCTWAKHISKDDMTLDPEFLARFKEVVDWAYEDDLFVIINIHHDGWLNRPEFTTDYQTIGVKLAKVWEQLAEYFKDYDQHLIFESMNEPRAKGTSSEWNGTEDGYKAVNYLNQVFVDTVRANTNGKNAERIIAIPGYAASNSAVSLREIEIPSFAGKPVENVMISIHCYSPYEFCLTDSQTTFSETNAADTSDIRRMIQDIKTLFLDNGIPAYIGECGCTNTKDNLEARIAWFNFFGKVTREANVPAIVWDNGAGGSSGGECHRYFMRRTGEMVNPELIAAFVSGYDPKNEAKDVVIDFEPQMQGDSAVLVTPKEQGFMPKELRCQAKINHTEEAKVGFSLMVDKSIEDCMATYDVSRFSGHSIKINGFMMSEGNEVEIRLAIAPQGDGSFKPTNGDGSLATSVALSSGEEWVEFNTGIMEIPLCEAAYVVFIGKNDSTYYIDDISVKIADGEIDTEDETAMGDGSSSQPPTWGDGSSASSNSEKKSVYKATLIFVGLLVIVIVIIIARRKRKNK